MKWMEVFLSKQCFVAFKTRTNFLKPSASPIYQNNFMNYSASTSSHSNTFHGFHERLISNKTLLQELKQLQKEPIEGFVIKNAPENLNQWELGIFGPPKTIYEGGYFKAIMKFPKEYPYEPPSLRFVTKMWHPNIYENGEVCISILHPPTEDPTAGELPQERWNPTQCVRSILLSVISMLNEPNIQSPANVDASVSYRKWKEGSSTDYAERVAAQVASSKAEAEKDGIVIPTTLDEYCIQHKSKPSMEEAEDYYMDDIEEEYYDDDDDAEDSGI